MGGSTQLHHAEFDFALASWKNIYVVIWRVHTTVDAAQKLREGATQFAENHPDGIGLLTIIEDGASAPPADSRVAIADFLRSSDFIRGSAVIFEGSSFRAAAVRSVVTGLAMIAGRSFPFQHKVFSTPREGVTWLFEEIAASGHGHSPDGFLAELREVRGEVDGRFPKSGAKAPA